MIAVRQIIGIVLHHVRQIHRLHNTVFFGIHSNAIDFIHVKPRYIKAVFFCQLGTDIFQNAFADAIVLQFQRAVNTAVLIVKINATEMPDQAGHGAYDIPLQIDLHQGGCKRNVHIFVLCVQRDSLYMAARNRGTMNVPGQLVPLLFHGIAPFFLVFRFIFIAFFRDLFFDILHHQSKVTPRSARALTTSGVQYEACTSPICALRKKNIHKRDCPMPPPMV